MPNYFSNNFLHFPVALIILGTNVKSSKFTPSSFIEIKQINIYACELLNLDITQTDLNQKFKEISQSYKIVNKTDVTNSNLYDNLLNPSCSFYVSNYVNDKNKIIYAKIKRTKENIFLVIDDYDHDKMLVQEKMMSTISKQHLITVSHELKNYFCGLLTTLEDCNINIDDPNIQNLAACIDLIKKNIKLYILYNKVCLDKIKFFSDKAIKRINFNEYLNQSLNKYTVIYKYKDITILNEEHLILIVETQFSYFKYFIHTLLLYVYYKSTCGNTVQIKMQRITNNKAYLFVTGTSTETAQRKPDNGLFDSNVENMHRLNHDNVKKSVITIPVLEYLLKNIAEFIGAEVILSEKEKSLNINSEDFCDGLQSFEITKEIVCIKFSKVSFHGLSNIGSIEDAEQEGKQTCIGFMKPKTYSKKNDTRKNNDLKLDTNIQKNKIIKPRTSQLIINPTHIKRSTYSLKNRGNHNGSSIDIYITQCPLKKRGDQSHTEVKSKSTVHHKNSKILIPSSPSKTTKYLQTNPLMFLYDRRNSYDKEKKSSSLKPNPKSVNSLKQPRSNKNFNIDSEIQSNYSGSSIIKMPGNKGLFSGKNSSLGLSEFDEEHSRLVHRKVSFQDKDLQETEIEENGANPHNSIYSRIDNIIKAENGASDNGDYLSFFLKPIKCDCADIAVVDDEKIITTSIQKIMKNQGYACDSFSDGKYLYDKILQKISCNCEKKFYKLILLDIYMLDWSGIKTCDKINELVQRNRISRGLRVIIISAHKESDLDIPRYDFIKGFYQKPVNKRAVISILEDFYNCNDDNS